ncbi:MAG: PaaI family thioesterase [Pseudomonadota bacterium]
MSILTPEEKAAAARIQQSFEKQAFVSTIGAQLGDVKVGAVDILLPRNRSLDQQYGFVHGGVLTAIADAAAGYAALTVSPDDVGVLTTELKVNFLRPASGSQLIAKGRVLKPGKTLSICTGDVFDIQEGNEKHVLTSLVTMMHVDGHSD